MMVIGELRVRILMLGWEFPPFISGGSPALQSSTNAISFA